MKNSDAPQSAAEMRSLADQAEAEAAEAEALAAAARARARAIQLRREAESVEAPKAEDKKPTEEVTAVESAPSADARVEPADSATTKVRGTRKPKPAVVKSVDEAPDAESADEPPAADAETDPVSDDDDAAEAAFLSGRTGPGLLSRRPKLSSVAAVLGVVIILVALGASVEMTVLHRSATRERQHVAEFAAAARQGVVTLTSLDFEHAKQGVQNILEVSTGTFKDDFLKMAEDFVHVVEDSKVVSQGTVQAAAVELDSMTDNSAVVLVASTSEVTNAAGAKQDPRKYRLIVTVSRDGGQLKMSKVEFVP